MTLFQGLSDKFTAMSTREKWLITVGGWVAIFFIILTLLLEPSFKVKAPQGIEYDSLKQSVRTKGELIVATNKKLKSNPNEAVDKQLARLKKRSADLSEKLDLLVESLVTPSKMAELLEKVLTSSKGLTLESLNSLPAEPVILGHSSKKVGYYIHPVRMEITGKYFDIRNYLAELENMPTSYFWRSYHYQVEEYPTGRLVLIVYTLSSVQEFIGG